MSGYTFAAIIRKGGFSSSHAQYGVDLPPRDFLPEPVVEAVDALAAANAALDLHDHDHRFDRTPESQAELRDLRDIKEQAQAGVRSVICANRATILAESSQGRQDAARELARILGELETAAVSYVQHARMEAAAKARTGKAPTWAAALGATELEVALFGADQRGGLRAAVAAIEGEGR